MAERQWKWACVEALAADEGGGVKCLVTDTDGRYAGVAPRHLAPEANKNADHVERFKPRRRLRRYTLELARARKRGMLHSYLPNGKLAPKGKLHTELAPNLAGASEVFAAALSSAGATPKADSKPVARAKRSKPKTTSPKAS